MVKKKDALKGIKKKSLKKVKAIKNNKNVLLNHQLEFLSSKIVDLEKEIIYKTKIIQQYKKQLTQTNAVISKMTKQIEEDLKHLYALHANLVPDKFPHIPNCDFSFKFIPSPKGIGKDFYQMIPIKKMYFGLVMSSCVSHILSSLLFSSQLKIRAQSYFKSYQPSDLLKDLVKEIHDRQSSSVYLDEVDIFYAIMNRKTFKLSYCSVGQINSFLYSYSTKEVHELSSLSSSFNLKSISNFSNKKITFNPKDRLIICSPGLASAMNKKKEMFGVDRLKETIRNVKTSGAHYLRNKIIYAIQSHSKDQTLGRDQSVIVMEIQDKILKLA